MSDLKLDMSVLPSYLQGNRIELDDANNENITTEVIPGNIGVYNDDNLTSIELNSNGSIVIIDESNDKYLSINTTEIRAKDNLTLKGQTLGFDINGSTGTSGQVLKSDGAGNVTWSNDNDTKNTTGSGSASGKMFLIGAKSQNAAGVQTYSDSKCYILNGVLYSNSAAVLNKNTTPTDYLQNIQSTLQSTHAIHYTKIGNNQFSGLIKPTSPCSVYEFEYDSLVNGLVVNLKASTRQTDSIHDVSGLQTMPFTQNIKIYMDHEAYISLLTSTGESLYIEPDNGTVSDIKYFHNIYRLSDRVIPTQRQTGLYTGDLSKISHTILDITCYYYHGQDVWYILVEQNVFLLTAS